MQINSLMFVLAAPAVILFYYLVPRKLRQLYVLLVSVAYYASFGLAPLAVLLFVHLITWGGGRLLFRNHSKLLFALFALLILAFLIGVRFLNPASSTWFGYAVPAFVTIPVGLSFYGLNAIGYLADTLKGEGERPLSILETGIFLCFFPVVTSGPILRAEPFRKQLNRKCRLSYARMRRAFLLVLFGYFMKLVVAERCALLTGTVYSNPELAGLPVVLAILLYSVQIYADFAGYSLIALGLSAGLGFDIPVNFRQPYFASSIKEFWRRWHISLSTWLRDYVYFPLGGSRVSTFRMNLNLLITFLVSGLWHGHGITFLVWGLLHGVFQILERFFVKAKADERFSSRLFHTAFTFLLVSLAWVFFRSADVKEALGILLRAVKLNNIGVLFTSQLFEYGLDTRNFMILMLGIAILWGCDYALYHGVSLKDWMEKQSVVLRILIVWILVFLTIISVNLSGAEFIYMQF